MQLDSLIHPNMTNSSVILSDSAILLLDDDISVDDDEVQDVDIRVVTCVLLEMGLSFLGILTNLLGEILLTMILTMIYDHNPLIMMIMMMMIFPFSVVTTIRHHESMQNSSLHLLLINLCFSNLLTSFLVKPISAIYSGYSLSVGTWQVNLKDRGIMLATTLFKQSKNKCLQTLLFGYKRSLQFMGDFLKTTRMSGEPGVLLAVHAHHVHHALHPALHPGGALLAAARPAHQAQPHLAPAQEAGHTLPLPARPHLPVRLLPSGGPPPPALLLPLPPLLAPGVRQEQYLD